MNDKHFFKLARKASQDADYTGNSGVSIGCVAVYKNNVLARGYNSDRTHTLQRRYNIYRFNERGPHYFPAKCHAEIGVLQKIKYLDIPLSKVHLYIYREFADGTPALARPCGACLAALQALKIKHIHYTTNNGYCHEILV